ncbi:hypothetical protein Tco_0490408 [Tanacetum coccineum]
MKRQNKDFSGRITPLFASILVPQVVEGEGSGQPSEAQPPSLTAPPSQVTTIATQTQKTHTPRRAKRGEDDRVVRVATTATSLEAVQESDAQTRFETASKKSIDPPLLEVNTSGSREDSMEHQDDLTDFVPPTPHDSPLSGGHTPGSDKGRPNLNELINLCTKLLNMVLALEQSKTAQDLVIIKLKKRVKRLEKALRARTPGMKLFKIKTSKRKSLDKENVSKQGKNDSTNKTEELNLCDKGSGGTEVFDDTTTAEKNVNAADKVNAADTVNVASVIPDVSAASPSSAAGPSTSTAGIFEDEMTTIADTLVAISSARPRTTSVVIHDVEEEPRRATPVPTVQSQDKGKGKLVEPEPTPKNPIKAQIARDAEIAQRLFKEEQAQFEKEQRIAREKAAEQEANDAALIE